jgi:hypothetical protein
MDLEPVIAVAGVNSPIIKVQKRNRTPHGDCHSGELSQPPDYSLFHHETGTFYLQCRLLFRPELSKCYHFRRACVNAFVATHFGVKRNLGIGMAF